MAWNNLKLERRTPRCSAAPRGLASVALVVVMSLAYSASWAADAKSFMVSALLKRDGSDAIVKLVHSRVVASDAGEARNQVQRQVKAEYHGYAVMDILVSDLGEKPAPCTGRVMLWAQGKSADPLSAPSQEKSLRNGRPLTRS